MDKFYYELVAKDHIHVYYPLTKGTDPDLIYPRNAKQIMEFVEHPEVRVTFEENAKEKMEEKGYKVE